MNELNTKALEGLAQFMLALTALLLLPAWSIYYKEAWIFLAVFGGSVLMITVYLMRKDPALLARRMIAGPVGEKEKKQKIIQSLAALAFISLFVVSSLDHRFMWSSVPGYANWLGDALVAIGLLGIFFVFKENTYTAGTVRVESEQKVISTGPYAIVRHPMYAAAFVMLVGVPFALDSLWGFVSVMAIVLAIIWRLLDEEKILESDLPGYAGYKHKVPYRLVPYIW
jgi:protein-S-isoprenylcysteine O-methyltransferase Ste14